MTVQDKATALSQDLAQNTLDAYPVRKCLDNGAFHCFTISQGENANIHILDDNGEQLNDNVIRWHDDTLVENSDLATVEQAFKDYINAQELVEKPSNVITYEELS